MKKKKEDAIMDGLTAFGIGNSEIELLDTPDSALHFPEGGLPLVLLLFGVEAETHRLTHTPILTQYIFILGHSFFLS